MYIDLNADMGESYGAWCMGNDAALLNIVSSANVACGFHAGDPDVMMKTMTLAKNNSVGIGAHPGFADLQGFGRRRLQIPMSTLQNQIRYQIGAAHAIAAAAGTHLRHVKLHGALSNMACEDPIMARSCYEAALSVVPDLTMIVLAATAQMEAVEELSCKWVGEIFADRVYNEDGTLLDRSFSGAIINDAKLAGRRVAQMIKEGAIITQSGKRIKTPVDTVCVHGDTPNAISIALSVRNAIVTSGIVVRKFN